jgi:Large polyvalent protein associated domain 29
MTAMSYHTIGSKYVATRDLDIAEVAGLIRKELKKAWPAAKFSVRIERYSQGQALHVEAVSQVPLYIVGTQLRPSAVEWREQIRQVVNAYNFDDSDGMSDHYHVRFATNIKLHEAEEVAA